MEAKQVTSISMASGNVSVENGFPASLSSKPSLSFSLTITSACAGKKMFNIIKISFLDTNTNGILLDLYTKS